MTEKVLLYYRKPNTNVGGIMKLENYVNQHKNNCDTQNPRRPPTIPLLFSPHFTLYCLRFPVLSLAWLGWASVSLCRDWGISFLGSATLHSCIPFLLYIESWGDESSCLIVDGVSFSVSHSPYFAVIFQRSEQKGPFSTILKPEVWLFW